MEILEEMWVSVARVNEVPGDSGVCAKVGDLQIAVFNCGELLRLHDAVIVRVSPHPVRIILRSHLDRRPRRRILMLARHCASPEHTWNGDVRRRGESPAGHERRVHIPAIHYGGADRPARRCVWIVDLSDRHLCWV